ncbi:S-adenosylmethionine decarboxylase, partial [Pseudomonas aeruginosa]|uniref:S-adenosylmethionine decarboxylase n=1 Tax=Pseudomonas aeruginosa TaxID=287 RepID=UPI003CC61B83
NIARHDYDPQGTSVTILHSEQPVTQTDSLIEESPGPLRDTILAHQDKSHITVHTYPEIHPVDGIATYGVDIDVSTCGVISPLKALYYQIHQIDW